MKILAIETSCDETGVSILEIKKTKQGQAFKVLANALSSQVKIHAPYGGVYPMLAKREHIKNLPILLEKVLKGSGIRAYALNRHSFGRTIGQKMECARNTGESHGRAHIFRFCQSQGAIQNSHDKIPSSLFARLRRTYGIGAH